MTVTVNPRAKAKASRRTQSLTIEEALSPSPRSPKSPHSRHFSMWDANEAIAETGGTPSGTQPDKAASNNNRKGNAK